MITFELDRTARRVALDGSPHVGALARRARSALETARVSTPASADEMWTVACSADDARDLLDWFERAADALLNAREDDQGTACSRAADASLLRELRSL
jgi:hypothetical protein